MLKITLPVAPSVNSYLGYRVGYIGGRPIVQSYEKKETVQYKRYAKKVITREMKNQNWEQPQKGEYVFMYIDLYLDRKRKDADNFLKVSIDTLTLSGAILDDDIIIPRINNIYLDKNNPRMEITLEIAPKKGIFLTALHLDSFKTYNCNQCKKSTYKRPCGILQRALDNRIEPEIDINKNICYEKKAM